MAASYRGSSGAPAVIVSGMVAGTPNQGGAAWAVMQYLIGLRQLGCEVTFVEPVDEPRRADRVRYCDTVMAACGMTGRWALVSTDGADCVGMDRPELIEAARRADVLLNISGMLADPDVLEAIDVRVYLDLDPLFIQMWHAVEGVDMRLDGHTHFVSVADTIGDEGSPIPTCGRRWIASLPPVVLDEWRLADALEHDAFTTVAHWRGYGSIHHDGVVYGQKAHSLRQFFDLPRRVPERFLLALGIHPDETADLAALRANGWELVDPAAVASTPDAYRRFVQGSTAEFGIAKSGYVLSRSGWFSDRSGCYLASGRPVVAQDTGFGRRLPVGRGLFAFSDANGVVDAVEELRRDPAGHRAAAREIAEEHLASDRVLGQLLEQVGS